MNKNKKRSAERDKKRARFMFSSAHVIIAIVAIIECLILISFTTYSWIETASSLIIWNGKKSIIDSEYTKMDIVGNLKYRFQVSSSSPNMNTADDLGDYFRSVEFFQFAKTSSPDGRNFFFKRPLAANSYRQGDTTDYNTSYLYFDFNVLNTSGKKLKFFFADDDVFSVTGIDSSKCQTITNAMRLSIAAGSGTPKIYAETATQTTARSNGTSGTTDYTPTAIENNENVKLFTVAKHSASSPGTNISCRIWLESEAAGMSSITAADLAAAKISVNLRFTYAENETDFLYFDDYTFSSKDENMGGHLTADHDESDSYRMYFVYRTSNSGGVVYPMTRASSQTNASALSWVTCDSSGNENATVLNTDSYPYITNLCNASHNAVTYSYFAYGPCTLTQSTVPSSFVYKWFLNSNSNDDNEHRFNAYSVVKSKLTETGATTSYGAGGWNWNTPLSMVYFRDRATGITENSYNTGSAFQYITASESGSSGSVMYVNNLTANIVTNNTSNAMQNQAKQTAALYYDVNADNRRGMFKSWVPTSWLSGSSMTFRYCPSGAYCLADEQIQWAAGAPSKATNSDDYIYTALGYDSLFTTDYYASRTSTPIYATGSGTWNAILSEPVYFTTELIDNYASADDRYMIGVKIGAASSFTNYALAPVTDGANQKFFAYLPDPNNGNTSGTADYAAGKISFTSYDKYSSASQTAAINARWLANTRNAGTTFYPVQFNASADSGYTRGYWHISVIVDGTYEHLFWDTGDPDTSADDGVLGHFYYNTTGHDTTFNASNYTEITLYQLDQYRWYVPLDSEPNATFIYYRWLPYSDVDLMFNHNIASGIYCIVTEASDATSNASSGALASFGSDDFSLNYLFGRNNAEPDSAVTEAEDEASDQSETYEDEEVIEEYVEEDFSYVDEDQTVDEYTDETVNNE